MRIAKHGLEPSRPSVHRVCAEKLAAVPFQQVRHKAERHCKLASVRASGCVPSIDHWDDAAQLIDITRGIGGFFSAATMPEISV